jgi:dipeptidyl aminopeptidase/acylaminoacyl peptidase
VRVVAETGEKLAAFDANALAAALGKSAGKPVEAGKLPFNDMTYVDGLRAIRFSAYGSEWEYDPKKATCEKVAATPKVDPKPAKPGEESEAEEPAEFDENRDAPQDRPRRKTDAKGREAPPTPYRSPDGNWQISVRDFNLFLKPKDGDEKALTTEGKEGLSFGTIFWSPDSKWVLAFRIEPGDRFESLYVESSTNDSFRGKLRSHVYPLPGDKFTTYEPWLIDVAGAKATKLATERIDWGRPFPRWSKDGQRLTYEKMDRSHQRFRVMGVELKTAAVKTLYDDAFKTFFLYYSNNTRYYLDATDELIINSERSGWNHLSLVDLKSGTIRNPITKGEYVVRRVTNVDTAKREIEFQANGRNSGQDPYFVHHYRVKFDGSGLVPLTDADGTHTIQKSPDGKYLIATHSRIDSPPVHELRRMADGKKIVELERADISKLIASGWKAPQVFVAPGRDGKTPIWGIVTRPRNFDPKKTYPVIEYIYAGPHDSHVPKGFLPYQSREALAELGFIVVQMDGMGTCNRSKAFHDVCWQNLADAGFPDRIAWIKALAKTDPSLDLTRVGIYGTSAGGQNSTGALLFHGDFYKVAVSSCGCHDNRMDKSSWNEQWMGSPVGPHYEKSSNVANAHKLKGKLLLIVGELDTNVPPESTYRLCDALIKAKKNFDFLMVPGLGHSDGGAYGERRRRDYFVKHLHGIEPPAWEN